jgi:hypothetical protein
MGNLSIYQVIFREYFKKMLCYFFSINESCTTKNAQQSAHPTLGILARFQAFFYASAFFQLGGFATTSKL